MKPHTSSSTLILNFRDGKSESLPILEFRTDKTNLSLQDLITEDQKHLFFTLLHKSLNTQIDLTGVSPIAILQFDEQGTFTGANLSLGNASGSFGIVIQAKHVLVLPFDASFPLELVTGIDLEQFRRSSAETFWEEFRKMPATIPQGKKGFIMNLK
jgi:hypothetical protein